MATTRPASWPRSRKPWNHLGFSSSSRSESRPHDVSVNRLPGDAPDPRFPPPGSPDAEPVTNGAAPARKAPPRSKTRSGIDVDDTVTTWTDEEWARATGLVQILDEAGQADPARLPRLSAAELVRIFRGMVLSRLLDTRLLPMQRQGRI